MKKLSRTLKIILCALFSSFIPVALCTWAISGMIKQEQLKAEYNVNDFTKYVQKPTKGNVIFDDTLTQSGAYLGYDISSDFSYDSTNRAIDLGDPKAGSITISQNIHLGHANDSSLNYSADQFSNTGNFANDGSVGGGLSTPNTKFATNRLYTIKLVSNVIIYSGVTFSVGAFLGTTGQGMSGGIINGNLVCLDLNGYTLTVSSGATLNAYGYIIDTKVGDDGQHIGKVVNNGSIYTGFVVEDFYGGGNTVGRGFASQMPFCLYSLPYLVCKVQNNYGSSIYAPTMLYAGGTANKTIINWFGPSSDYFLQLTSNDANSGLVIDTYNNLTNVRKEYISNFRTEYTFRGKFQQNSLKLNINFSANGNELVRATIDMAQFNFYIPPYARIYLKGDNSSINFNMNFCFMPGATLETDEGTSLNFSSISYDSYVQVAIKKSIKSGTSYGGIVSLSNFPPSINSGFSASNGDGDTNNLYNFQISDFSKYITEENENISSGKARLIINGNLNFADSVNNLYTLSGMAYISDTAESDLISNIDKVNTFFVKSENFGNVSDEISLGSWALDVTGILTNIPTNLTYGGYIISPLLIVNANNNSNRNLIGRVFNAKSEVFSGLSNDVYFDFKDGYYYDITTGKYFGYVIDENQSFSTKDPNSLNAKGNFIEIDDVFEDHTVGINGDKYIYFEDTFLLSTEPANSENYLADGYYIQTTDNNGNVVYNKIRNNSVLYKFEADVIQRLFRGAEDTNNESFCYNIHNQKQNWRGSWGDDSYSTEFYGLPTKKFLIKEIAQGKQEIYGYLNIKDISNIDSFFNTTENAVNVEAVVLSQTAKRDIAYQLTDSVCTVYINGEDELVSSTDWKLDSNVTSPNHTDDWNESGKRPNKTRSRNEYYKWYDMQKTETYVNGIYEKASIPLYKRSFVTDTKIKYDNNLKIWLRA